ncbi:unnamed protein product [Acanthoscelides obtectus]|uniref:Uncharacterized protein n=1 Tax=Acanthoscelides obtectus TaxID=200917 RepID=A0A9P0L822_ACAOB|nr:unnamed protein product [Acanthoscelides obtectus]CAK1671099.1 hypothetical protein AOBTE_LOCUS28055 [Acanthoscelides obtectus]
MFTSSIQTTETLPARAYLKQIRGSSEGITRLCRDLSKILQGTLLCSYIIRNSLGQCRACHYLFFGFKFNQPYERPNIYHEKIVTNKHFN